MKFTKASPVFLALLILCLCSCNPKQEQNAGDVKTRRDSLVPYQVTVLAELPDSLQPKTYLLGELPKPPKTVVSKMLPASQNAMGETILDVNGKPYPTGDGGKSNFTNLTSSDGLPLDNVNCSLQDQFGNIWFGTLFGGVSCYDGKSFTTFTTAQGLASNVVQSIIEDKCGNIWFGTHGGGVSRYDGKSFTTFTTAQGLGHNTAESILEDKKGNLWFGTFAGGVSRYDGQSFTTFNTTQGLADNYVMSILEDKKGNLWFGTFAGGVSRYDPSASLRTGGQSFTTFNTAKGLANNQVKSILEDKKGNLWFGTAGGGVSRYDGKSFSNFTTTQGLVHNVVHCMVEDKAGNLWFGTRGGGVSRYDGQSFVNFTTVQGLPSNEVNSIMEDKNGNLWFCTDGGGVSRYDGPSFNTFTTTEGLAGNAVLSITEDKKGDLWFLTWNGGVSSYNGQSFSNFIPAQGFPLNYLITIFADTKDNLWFGAQGAVSCYDPSASRKTGSHSILTFPAATTSTGVHSIAEDKNGNIWFSNAGVSRYDGQSLTNFNTAQGLGRNFVMRILADKKGNLWFATVGGGVSRYDGQSFSTFTTAHGLADNSVGSILEDKKGNLWFGTVEGLSVMPAEDVSRLAEKRPPSTATESAKSAAAKKDKGIKNLISSSLFKSFTIADGLPDNAVIQVLQLPNGKMAIGTNQGITIFSPSRDLDKLNDLETYNTNTGYPVKNLKIGQNAMFVDSKGIIWAGTGSDKTALVRFDYKALQKKNSTPTLLIQAIKVKNENICWYNLQSKGIRKDKQDSSRALVQEFLAYGKPFSPAQNEAILKRFGNIQFEGITPFYPLPQKLKLPYEHNQVSFEFAAVETVRPQMVKYQYMLEGYDKNWSPVTNRANASFGNIYEGTYTFKLKAQGANGAWTKLITYTFRVLPPWYRSWWAYTTYGILLLISIYRFDRYQKQRIIKKERQRTMEREVAQAKEIEKAYAELKTTQAQLIQSEKLASLGELTAGIAHEIQNPLNFVNNFAEVSAEMLVEMHEELEKGDTTEAIAIATDLKTNLEKINHHGQRASSIVKGMLEHSRTSSGVKEPTDINALADEYLRLAYHGLRAKDDGFNVAMETHFDPDLPLVSVIPQDIGRVLLNLINNAFYAVHQRAIVGVTRSHADTMYQPTVTISTQKIGDHIIIKVQDNGNGIPEAIKDKIFQPFFTTKPTGQGTGLGLSLAYDIVTKGHGGTLEVESTEGVGSEFIISLPFRTNG
jgi:ligand-binding sensor domain-containing protein/signal transduction histidine kinase